MCHQPLHTVCCLIAGVADGVGSWVEVKVDAGAYARLLMKHAQVRRQHLAQQYMTLGRHCDGLQLQRQPSS